VRALALICRHCDTTYEAQPAAICEECIGPLEPAYDTNRPRPDRAEIARRSASLWRYHEWLPIAGEPVFSREVGFTPLIEVPRLARVLGVGRLWIKHDGVSFPSLSFKDRVVASGINAAHALGLATVGCASTGNLANAVAAQAARAGMPAWVFIPDDLETGKVIGTAVYGPNLVRVRGSYDDVNRLCAQVADRFGWGILNVNLRSYYGEGSKTVGFEIAEQLGWRLPTAVVVPMAGGSLVTKIHKGFGEFLADGIVTGTPPRMFGAQADGCAPIVRLVERGAGRIEPGVPATVARSIAIGNPADGASAARVLRDSGGWAAAVTDAELVEGIRLLAERAGVFTETAGGVTVAAAAQLTRSGRLTADDEVVLCITGNGLKTTEVVGERLEYLPVISPSIGAVSALVEAAEATAALTTS
jgi:threonine synthase